MSLSTYSGNSSNLIMKNLSELSPLANFTEEMMTTEMSSNEIACISWAFEHNAEAKRFPGPLANWFKILVTFLDAFLILITLMGGLTTVYVVYKIRFQSSRLSCLFGCLAASDILTAIVLMVFDVPLLWNDDFAWSMGAFGCKVAGFLQSVAILVNSNVIIAIAVDRYLGIVQAPKQRVRPEWRGIQIILFVSFIVTVSFGISVPYLVLSNISGPYLTYTSIGSYDFVEIRCDQYFCWSDIDEIYVFQVILVCVIVVPMVVTFIICYGFLLHFITKKQMIGASYARQQARRRKVLVTVSAMMTNFLLLRTPSWIFLLVPQTADDSETESHKAYSYTHYCLQVLTLCAFALDPILYSLLQQDYRKFLPNLSRTFTRSKVNPQATWGTPPSGGTVASRDTLVTTVSNYRSTRFSSNSSSSSVLTNKETGGGFCSTPKKIEPMVLSGCSLYEQVLSEECNLWNKVPVPRLSIVMEEEESEDKDHKTIGSNS